MDSKQLYIDRKSRKKIDEKKLMATIKSIFRKRGAKTDKGNDRSD